MLARNFLRQFMHLGRVLLVLLVTSLLVATPLWLRPDEDPSFDGPGPVDAIRHQIGPADLEVIPYSLALAVDEAFVQLHDNNTTRVYEEVGVIFERMAGYWLQDGIGISWSLGAVLFVDDPTMVFNPRDWCVEPGVNPATYVDCSNEPLQNLTGCATCTPTYEIQYADYLSAWQTYRQANATVGNYKLSFLLSGFDFYESVIGYTSLPGFGIASSAGGIIQATFDNEYNANILAHEMGHSFGMAHDSTGNSCDPSAYIMGIVSSPAGPHPDQFSDCSISYLEDFLTNYAGPAEPIYHDLPTNITVHISDPAYSGDLVTIDVESPIPLHAAMSPSCGFIVNDLTILPDTDSDRDGLSDEIENLTTGSLWNDSDSDDDTYSDLVEDIAGTDPANAGSVPGAPFFDDRDGDGLDTSEETGTYLTNESLFDTDGDGFGDGHEVSDGTDPLDMMDWPMPRGPDVVDGYFTEATVLNETAITCLIPDTGGNEFEIGLTTHHIGYDNGTRAVINSSGIFLLEPGSTELNVAPFLSSPPDVFVEEGDTVYINWTIAPRTAQAGTFSISNDTTTWNNDPWNGWVTVYFEDIPDLGEHNITIAVNDGNRTITDLVRVTVNVSTNPDPDPDPDPQNDGNDTASDGDIIDLLQENSLYIGAALGGLVLILLIIVIMRKRNKPKAASSAYLGGDN